MANTLIVEQSQVFVGLGTLTYTIPTTGIWHVKFECTVPSYVSTGDGAGSGTGLGSGAGGGAGYNGFSGGGQGAGAGQSGYGFGTGSGYPQPLASGSNETLNASVSSSLVVVVKNGASTIFTAPVLGASQSAMQFKYSFLATAADVITVVLTSSDAEDNFLNTVKSIISIGVDQ